MAIQNKSKLRIYRESTWKIGFEEYLDYAKAAPSRLLSKFCSGTHGLFEELGRDKGGGSQECQNCWTCKVLVEQVLFECILR